MTSEFRPLREVLRELRALTQQKASGFFFVVTDDNHSCTIRLRSGQIDDVNFSRQRNDEAIQLLAQVPAARARFQPIAVNATGKASLSRASLDWLLGGFEFDSPAAAPAPAQAGAHAPATAAGAAHAREREILEKIALNYFGPIASLLCDEAFSAGGDSGQILQQIASNLPGGDEANRFVAEARAALSAAR